ncbi:MAG: hypothetical protein LBO73_02705, partial [Holosporaceae bacterium]|nr:hypothetical protein [Holosporaceae bacterium]
MKKRLSSIIILSTLCCFYENTLSMNGQPFGFSGKRGRLLDPERITAELAGRRQPDSAIERNGRRIETANPFRQRQFAFGDRINGISEIERRIEEIFAPVPADGRNGQRTEAANFFAQEQFAGGGGTDDFSGQTLFDTQKELKRLVEQAKNDAEQIKESERRKQLLRGEELQRQLEEIDNILRSYKSEIERKTESERNKSEDLEEKERNFLAEIARYTEEIARKKRETDEIRRRYDLILGELKPLLEKKETTERQIRKKSNQIKTVREKIRRNKKKLLKLKERPNLWNEWMERCILYKRQVEREEQRILAENAQRRALQQQQRLQEEQRRYEQIFGQQFYSLPLLTQYSQFSVNAPKPIRPPFVVQTQPETMFSLQNRLSRAWESELKQQPPWLQKADFLRRNREDLVLNIRYLKAQLKDWEIAQFRTSVRTDLFLWGVTATDMPNLQTSEFLIGFNEEAIRERLTKLKDADRDLEKRQLKMINKYKKAAEELKKLNTRRRTLSGEIKKLKSFNNLKDILTLKIKSEEIKKELADLQTEIKNLKLRRDDLKSDQERICEEKKEKNAEIENLMKKAIPQLSEYEREAEIVKNLLKQHQNESRQRESEQRKEEADGAERLKLLRDTENAKRQSEKEEAEARMQSDEATFMAEQLSSQLNLFHHHNRLITHFLRQKDAIGPEKIIKNLCDFNSAFMPTVVKSLNYNPVLLNIILSYYSFGGYIDLRGFLKFLKETRTATIFTTNTERVIAEKLRKFGLLNKRPLPENTFSLLPRFSLRWKKTVDANGNKRLIELKENEDMEERLAELKAAVYETGTETKIEELQDINAVDIFIETIADKIARYNLFADELDRHIAAMMILEGTAAANVDANSLTSVTALNDLDLLFEGQPAVAREPARYRGPNRALLSLKNEKNDELLLSKNIDLDGDHFIELFVVNKGQQRSKSMSVLANACCQRMFDFLALRKFRGELVEAAPEHYEKIKSFYLNKFLNEIKADRIMSVRLNELDRYRILPSLHKRGIECGYRLEPLEKMISPDVAGMNEPGLKALFRDVLLRDGIRIALSPIKRQPDGRYKLELFNPRNEDILKQKINEANAQYGRNRGDTSYLEQYGCFASMANADSDHHDGLSHINEHIDAVLHNISEDRFGQFTYFSVPLAKYTVAKLRQLTQKCLRPEPQPLAQLLEPIESLSLIVGTLLQGLHHCGNGREEAVMKIFPLLAETDSADGFGLSFEEAAPCLFKLAADSVIRDTLIFRKNSGEVLPENAGLFTTA